MSPTNLSYREKRNTQIDIVFMNVAKDISQLSHCVRAKVGAIIVSIDNNISAIGFNGTPAGYENTCENEIDGNLVTKAETLHAESNSIAKIARTTLSSNGSTMYVTMSPCFECSKLIIQSGFKRVVYLEEYRDSSGIDFLKENGILVEKIEI
jgi:dCMP deaminase